MRRAQGGDSRSGHRPLARRPDDQDPRRRGRARAAGQAASDGGTPRGLTGVGHVIADAAYDAGHLRELIADSLGAEAQIHANPSRARTPPLDPDLYAERHKVENFFQRIKRFRRIALRCEKTLASYMGFVFLVSALDWLR
jgi:transposase